MDETPTCPACRGPLIQKDRRRLFFSGLLLVGLAGGVGIWPGLRIAGLLALLVGVYLLVWAIRGRGLWCRHCKKFPTGL